MLQKPEIYKHLKSLAFLIIQSGLCVVVTKGRCFIYGFSAVKGNT